MFTITRYRYLLSCCLIVGFWLTATGIGCTAIYSQSYYVPETVEDLTIQVQSAKKPSEDYIYTTVEHSVVQFDQGSYRFEFLAYDTIRQELILVGPLIPIFPLGLFDMIFYPEPEDKDVKVDVFFLEAGGSRFRPDDVIVTDLETPRTLSAEPETLLTASGSEANTRLRYHFGTDYPPTFRLHLSPRLYAGGPHTAPAVTFQRKYGMAVNFGIWY